MADTTEKVEYIFEGDVSALRKSTTDAISLLKQYGAAIQKTAASTDFKASKTSLSSFTSAVGATITQVNTLVKALNKLGPEAMDTLAPQISNIQDATNTLKDSLEFLDGGLVTTSKDFNELAEYVRESKATFEAAASKAYGMATSFKDLGTLSDTAGAQVKTSMQGASEATNTFADRTAQNIQSYRSTIEKMQALNFASEISAQYDTITKSARESAQAFASMSRQESLSATYGPALGKLIDLSDQGRVKLALLGATMKDQWNSITSVFDPIVAKVQAFKDKASESFQGIAARASTVAQAFRRIVQGETDADASANKTAQGHRTLGDTLRNLVSKFRTETEAVDNEDQKLKNKNNTLGKSSKLHSTLSQAVQHLGNSFKQELSKLKSFASNLKSINPAAGLAKKALNALASIRITDVIAKSAKQAINYVENLNLFTVAMGDSVKQGKEFVKGMQEIYGMDPSNLYRYAGYFYQLTDAIGMADKASATMSLSMTKASNDIASLFNVPVEEVVNNLASGMQGMSRAVRKYGMDIRAVTLQQTAANYGITTQVETMSEADRMALRYITMMNQVSNALKQTTDSTDDASKEMGDFARNIETPANQLRIFKEQITQLGRAIGNFLITPLSKVLPYINGFIMALREAINFVGSLLGVLQETDTTVSTSGATSEIEAIGTAADEALQKVKNLTAPFDELNVLSESSSSGSSVLSDALDPRLEEAIANMQLGLDNVRMKANDVRDSILNLIGLGTGSEGGIVAAIGGFVAQIIRAWSEQDYTQIGAVIATFLNQGLVWAVSNLTWENLGPGIQNTVDIIAGTYNGFMASYDWASLGTIIGNGLNVAIYAGQSFVQGVDWSVGGQAMADGFNNIVNTIDWAALGGTVSKGITGILTSVYTFLENTDWQALGQSVKEFLVNIDWNNVAESTFRAIGAAFGALTGFLWGLIKDAWNSVVEWWHDKAFEDGEFTLQGLLDGIVEVVKNIGSWIKDHIFKPFITGFKNAFGIHSPSTVMAEMGDYLLEGLFNGMANIGEKIKGWGKNFLDGIKNALGIHSPSKEFEEIGEYSIAGLSNGFADMSSVTKEFQIQLVIMKKYAQEFSNETLTIITTLLTKLVEALNKSLDANKAFTVSMSKMFKTMSTTVISYINNIISALDSIPRNITTVHTIVTKELSESSVAKIKSGTKMPMMAGGGVVTSPTIAMIGEGKYSEAVIPLDDSPQMNQLVERIADALDDPDRNPKNAPVNVRVFIGDTEWDAFTYKSAERGKKSVGVQPITTGG